MKRFRRRVALQHTNVRLRTALLTPVSHSNSAVLLDGNDPVIVLVEPVQDYRVDAITMSPSHLWTSSVETNFDPHSNGLPDGRDRDGDGYPDDPYGWNFITHSPVFAYPSPSRSGARIASQNPDLTADRTHS